MKNIILLLIVAFFPAFVWADDTPAPLDYDDGGQVEYQYAREAMGDSSSYGFKLCEQPGLKCIDVKEGETWYHLFPDKLKREIVMRLNRTNVALKYRKWLVVPATWKEVDYRHYSPLPQHLDTSGHKLLLIDLSKFAFAAYDAKGDQEFWGPASGGKEWCDDLNRSCASVAGKFHIFRKQGEDCTSSTYPIADKGGAPMPYCMHYFNGYAIHASTLMGFVNRSRGCVRLFNDDAKWLNEHFVNLGTRVIVEK